MDKKKLRNEIYTKYLQGLDSVYAAKGFVLTAMVEYSCAINDDLTDELEKLNSIINNYEERFYSDYDTIEKLKIENDTLKKEIAAEKVWFEKYQFEAGINQPLHVEIAGLNKTNEFLRGKLKEANESNESLCHQVSVLTNQLNKHPREEVPMGKKED